MSHGWEPASEPFRVTEAEGVRLISLNGLPAAEAFEAHAAATGQTLDPAAPIPFFLHNILGIETASGHKLRVPLAIFDDGAVLCAAEVPQDCDRQDHAQQPSIDRRGGAVRGRRRARGAQWPQASGGAVLRLRRDAAAHGPGLRARAVSRSGPAGGRGSHGVQYPRPDRPGGGSVPGLPQLHGGRLPASRPSDRPASLQRLVNALSEREGATRAAEALARAVGAEALLILIRDPDSGAIVPAPGFPRTLPGGPTWRAFLNGLRASGRIRHGGRLSGPT